MSPFAFLQTDLPIAFAHRGGASEAPENTLAAFGHAVSLGYRYIETDVQATRDGIAVIFHDDDLKRLVGRPEAVGDLDWSELRNLRVAGEEIPRLDDLLTAWPELRINLEPKSDSAVVPIAEAIRRAAALDRVCVGSFQEARVRRLRELLGAELCWSPGPLGVFRVWATGHGLPLGAPDCAALQVPTHFRGIPLVTRKLVRAAHARGLQVHVWTVDKREEMERLLDLGVDGLMTDRPTLLRDVLRTRGLWS